MNIKENLVKGQEVIVFLYNTDFNGKKYTIKTLCDYDCYSTLVDENENTLRLDRRYFMSYERFMRCNFNYKAVEALVESRYCETSNCDLCVCRFYCNFSSYVYHLECQKSYGNEEIKTYDDIIFATIYSKINEIYSKGDIPRD